MQTSVAPLEPKTGSRPQRPTARRCNYATLILWMPLSHRNADWKSMTTLAVAFNLRSANKVRIAKKRRAPLTLNSHGTHGKLHCWRALGP